MIPQVKCLNCKNLSRDGWCEQIADSPHEDLDRQCDFFKPCTNGDYIRRMTDDELAVFLSDKNCSACPVQVLCHSVRGGFENWLKEESNVEEQGK